MNFKKWSWKELDPSGIPAEKLNLEFEANLLEAAIAGVDWEGSGAAAPSAGEVGCLVSLHDIYSRLKQKHKGLQVDQLLVKVCPEDKKLRYNLACSHSLLGEIDDAVIALDCAFELGYDNFDHMKRDPDLANLREDPRYRLYQDRFQILAKELENLRDTEDLEDLEDLEEFESTF